MDIGESMIEMHVVRLATEYLDYCFAKNEQATLVAMLNWIDAKDKTVANLDEVNDALRQRPAVSIQRIAGKIVFGSTGSDQAVTDDELRQACADYREEFRLAYEKLKSGK
jgi:hypothetical protein